VKATEIKKIFQIRHKLVFSMQSASTQTRFFHKDSPYAHLP
jgi:hypothetical protein